jgi:hypothetical protein
MEIKLYPLLSTCSKRALTKRYYKYSKTHPGGQPYRYNPRGRLLNRLSRETMMSVDEVYLQLLAEREYLLRNWEL